MLRSRLLILLGAGILVGACAESTGPPVDPPREESADPALHVLRWKETESPRRFRVTRHPSPEVPQVLPGTVFSSSPSEISVTEVHFWAVRGEERSVEIEYQDASGSDTFLQLTVPDDGLLRRPDGTQFQDGDSVLISVTIDTVRLMVDLEPSGLVFSSEAPAELQIWYSGADEDLDGDGAVDATDAYIEDALLGVWYRQNVDDPWSGITATRSIEDKQFTAGLLHFTGYAVSY